MSTMTRWLVLEELLSRGLDLGLRLSSHVVHSSHRPANQRMGTPEVLTLAANHKARVEGLPTEDPQALLTPSLTLKLQQG